MSPQENNIFVTFHEHLKAKLKIYVAHLILSSVENQQR